MNADDTPPAPRGSPSESSVPEISNPGDRTPDGPASADGPTGGCLCGRIRYRLAAVPTDVGHCHCRICQRSAGAAFLTWATVERTDLAVLAGAPHWHRSSPAARRGFCPDCGTQLFFAFDADASTTRPDVPPEAASTVDVTVASLDEPDLCRPTRNIWVGTRRAFLHGFDEALPDHVDEGPAPPADHA